MMSKTAQKIHSKCTEGFGKIILTWMLETEVLRMGDVGNCSGSCLVVDVGVSDTGFPYYE
jgi:hypothetical protein